MKTTLDLNDELLARAKAFSARERKTLTALIEEGLQLRMRRTLARKTRRRPPLVIHAGVGSLVKGVDALSNRALFDAADDGA